jgi:hypothetical protein
MFINRQKKVKWVMVYLHRNTVHFFLIEYFPKCWLYIMFMDTGIAI